MFRMRDEIPDISNKKKKKSKHLKPSQQLAKIICAPHRSYSASKHRKHFFASQCGGTQKFCPVTCRLKDREDAGVVHRGLCEPCCIEFEIISMKKICQNHLHRCRRRHVRPEIARVRDNLVEVRKRLRESMNRLPGNAFEMLDD